MIKMPSEVYHLVTHIGRGRSPRKTEYLSSAVVLALLTELPFTMKEMEAQRALVTEPRPHSQACRADGVLLIPLENLSATWSHDCPENYEKKCLIPPSLHIVSCC